MLSRHYYFGFITLCVSWYAMLSELPAWVAIRHEMSMSIKQGFYTDALVGLRNSERGVEGVVHTMLATYGLPWAMRSTLDFWVTLFSILIGLRGLVLLVRERDSLQ